MRRRRVPPLWLLAAAMIAAPALAQLGFPARYVAGEHYRVLQEPAPAPEDGVEVIEFFLYACPFCRAFEPAFQTWADRAPEGVTVRQVPAPFRSDGPIYARLFYTAEALGMREELHGEVFSAIHEHGRRLNSRAAIRAFFVGHGADGAAFDAAFGSDEVTAKVQRAAELVQVYRVASVPSLGVNGRYWISPRTAGGTGRMLEIADYLIARTRDSR